MEDIKKTVIMMILAMIVVGVIIFAGNAVKKYRIETWPSVEGTILYSRVISDCGTFQEAYHPVVQYAYTVNGKKYIKTTYRHNYKLVDKERAQKIVDKYPKGATVIIYYNSKKPAHSILDDFFSLSGT